MSKLSNKQNWISELYTLKNSIPATWKTILKSNESIKTKVKTDLKITLNSKTLCDITNKDFYNYYLKSIFEKPYIHNYWEQTLRCKINWDAFYLVLNKTLPDNKIKQFKYKAIHRILATNANLFKWNIVNSPLCKLCNEVEDYEHFFIHCKYLDTFWSKVDNTFKKCGFHKSFRNLKCIIFGYKLEFAECRHINILLNIIAYCIYKTYFISERRTQFQDMYYTLYYDIIVIIKYFDNKNTKPLILRKFLNSM